MNRKYDTYAWLRCMLLLLLTCGALSACRQDGEFDDMMPVDPNTLVASGRYLTARNAEAPLLDDGDEARWFDVGTRYRLLAFVKKYDEDNFLDKTPAAVLRFDEEAWEDEVKPGGLRFIRIDGNPDQLFGFQALAREPADGTDGLVSLDFYGFTYGVKAEASAEPYIPLTGTTNGALDKLKRRETVDANSGLNDLMRGVLLNQNIRTAGNRDYVENPDNLPPAEATQSILPFTHCFARLDIQVLQQEVEKTDEDGNPVTDENGNPVLEPAFGNLWVEGIRVTNTYREGDVYLKDGLVEVLGDPYARPLPFRNADGEAVDAFEVKTTVTEAGRMLVFPSAGEALANSSLADGYVLGMEIDVRCDNRTTMAQFLVNTETAGDLDKAQQLITSYTDAAGKEWFRATVKKAKILNNLSSDFNTPLYLKQNTIYRLVVTFQKNAVRIVTVIPLVEPWLPGEGDDKDPWQDQALGQPQMFDNVLWSDRNLGADHFDPHGANGAYFEQTVGYFYQPGRNIPYFPFYTLDYYDENSWGRWTMPNPPTLADKRTKSLADNITEYKKTRHRLYPMVDERLLRMKRQTEGYGADAVEGDNTWTLRSSDGNKKAQLYIPETKAEVENADRYFDFARECLTDEDNMVWYDNPQNQPVSGSWVVPTSKDFLTIFPSTPHAGNITFARGGNNSNPTAGWGHDYGGQMNNSFTTLRVTVPYYVPGMSEPTGRSDKYKEAWHRLDDNHDAGTTHTQSGDNAYSNWGPSNSTNIDCEPDGDPEDGYASVYIISREDDGDKVLLNSGPNPPASYAFNYAIKEWGTIYAIKRAYTAQAYRMRWRVLVAGYYGSTDKKAPGLYIEICRYRCNQDDTLTEENFKTKYDWDHPAARIYFPITGLGDFKAIYINFGTECQYATSDPISNGKTSAVQIKITGTDTNNAYMSVVKGNIRRDFGMQIRPVGGVNNSK